MNTTADDVLQFVRENDVKFIRLAFCDPFGTQKNMAILPDEDGTILSKGEQAYVTAI